MVRSAGETLAGAVGWHAAIGGFVTDAAPMRALLIDPSLFTAPYDAALSEGLEAAGVATGWAARGPRPDERPEIDGRRRVLTCYRLTDGPRRRQGRGWQIAKGIEHAIDLRRIERAARDHDVVHFQWGLVPLLDAAAMRRIGRARPVVLTVHDTTPLNGARVSAAQVKGFAGLLDAADALIVHTDGARVALIAQGVAAARIHLVPHGPLPLACAPEAIEPQVEGRWRIVQFGRIQSYKGVDLLIEAIARLAPETQAQLQVIVAGEPFIDLAPLRARADALGLAPPLFELRAGRLDDQAMADLLHGADAFVFPYRAIEASGVLFLVAGLNKWIVASRLGAFADVLRADGLHGMLVAPGDIDALAAALAGSIGRAPPTGGRDWAPSWTDIGLKTRAIYHSLCRDRTIGSVSGVAAPQHSG
ncbi:glycosyltransferase [Sphingomonas sp. 1P06PA]|uniref:glycosyltransferase n=1 Tax=Sphingomonas sp. 1P06PA TaxID=554121 RepID=UPI0039A68DEB